MDHQTVSMVFSVGIPQTSGLRLRSRNARGLRRASCLACAGHSTTSGAGYHRRESPLKYRMIMIHRRCRRGTEHLEQTELRQRHGPQYAGGKQPSAGGRGGGRGPLHKSTQDRLDRQAVLQVGLRPYYVTRGFVWDEGLADRRLEYLRRPVVLE